MCALFPIPAQPDEMNDTKEDNSKTNLTLVTTVDSNNIDAVCNETIAATSQPTSPIVNEMTPVSQTSLVFPTVNHLPVVVGGETEENNGNNVMHPLSPPPPGAHPPVRPFVKHSISQEMDTLEEDSAMGLVKLSTV